MNTNQKSYLSTKYTDVYIDLDTKIGYAIWKDYCNEEDYKSTLIIQEKMIKSEKMILFLVDIINFKGTSVANAKWTNDVMQPLLYNSSLKKMVYVVGQNAFSNFTLTIIKKKLESDGVLLTNAFTNTAAAENWLLEKML